MPASLLSENPSRLPKARKKTGKTKRVVVEKSLGEILAILDNGNYHEKLTVAERKKLFDYFKETFQTPDAFAKFQADILFNIEDNLRGTANYFSENNDYHSALSFILRLNFSLLQSSNQTEIEQFIQKPYRPLHTHVEAPDVKQPNHFLAFCQRHPYLTAIPLALATVGLFIGGFATFGALHLLMGLPIFLLAVSLPAFVPLFAQPIKAICAHFIGEPAVTNVIDLASDQASQNTKAILDKFAGRLIEQHIETLEVDEDNTCLEDSREISKPRPSQVSPEMMEHIQAVRVNYAGLIHRFTAFKPKNETVSKPARPRRRKVWKTAINNPL